MINHGKVESNTRPDDIKLDEYSVWIAEGITEFEMDGEKIYSYELTQYPKDEYTLMKLSETEMLHAQIQASNGYMDFLEEVIVEMAQMVYE